MGIDGVKNLRPFGNAGGGPQTDAEQPCPCRISRNRVKSTRNMMQETPDDKKNTKKPAAIAMLRPNAYN